MRKLEKAALDLSEKISAALHFSDEKRSVIAYGLTAVFQMAAIAAAISVIGLLSRSFYECVIVFLGVGLLKKSTGGAHSQTMNGCMVISVISISVLALLSRYVLNKPFQLFLSVGVTAAIYLACLVIFYRRVPVDCANKRLTKPEKIKKLRRQSFVLLTVYLIVTLVLLYYAPEHRRFYSLSSCVCMIMMWQTFMLTTTAAKAINVLDSEIFIKEG